ASGRRAATRYRRHRRHSITPGEEHRLQMVAIAIRPISHAGAFARTTIRDREGLLGGAGQEALSLQRTGREDSRATRLRHGFSGLAQAGHAARRSEQIRQYRRCAAGGRTADYRSLQAISGRPATTRARTAWRNRESDRRGQWPPGSQNFAALQTPAAR